MVTLLAARRLPGGMIGHIPEKLLHELIEGDMENIWEPFNQIGVRRYARRATNVDYVKSWHRYTALHNNEPAVHNLCRVTSTIHIV